MSTLTAVTAVPSVIPVGYPTPTDQLEFVMNRNMDPGWGFSEGDFLKLGIRPEFEPGKSVVLDVQLGEDPHPTFEAAWKAIVAIHGKGGRTIYDITEVKVRDGVSHERGLYWRQLHLQAHWGKWPGDISGIQVGSMPSSAVLWAAAYFPNWVRGVYSIFIPGYQVSISLGNTPRWGYMPGIKWEDGFQRIELISEYVRELSDSVIPTY